MLPSFFTKAYVYAGDAFYSYDTSATEENVLCNQYILEQVGSEWADAEFMQYNYDALALFLDTSYGLDQHVSRVSGKTITYMPNGAYALLAPYKDKLLSTKKEVSNDAMIEIFDKVLDDGGHTSYASANLFSEKAYERTDVCGAETKNTFDTMNGITEARKAKGTDIDTVLKEEDAEAYANAKDHNGYYKEYHGDTAYIQFDSFTTNSVPLSPGDVTSKNYYENSVSLFYYANQQIQNNPNIKNVVIDLAGNTGGTMYASEFISSWVCGGTRGVMRDAKTKAMLDYTVRADVDFDGAFTKNDYLDSDINVYVVTSNCSFSCANKLPTNIEDNRKENTYFVGAQTGGGSCSVSYAPFTYVGGAFRISSNTQIGRVGSTVDNFISNENGVKPTNGYEIENTNYAKFADVDSIINLVRSSN